MKAGIFIFIFILFAMVSGASAAETITLVSPANNSYVNTTQFYFNIPSAGTIVLYIDGNEMAGYYSACGGTLSIPFYMAQGYHTWYMGWKPAGTQTWEYTDTWGVTYDTVPPTIIDADTSGDEVVQGNDIKFNIMWQESNVEYIKFYVDVGDGYELVDTKYADGWFNKTVSTSGMGGKTISVKQVATDKVGYTANYEQSFEIILDAVQIRVFDERTGTNVTPSQIRLYSESINKFAVFNSTTNTSTVSYNGLSTGKHVLQVAADGYYPRRAILQVDTTGRSDFSVYLPDENETVIYDTFKIIDNSISYRYSDIIVRLDKPLQDGTATVFSSYLDFAGTAATYLIASDQYILYIITPEETLTYGWLTPDADGQIEITLNGITIQPYYDKWYSYNYSVSNGLVNLDYSAKNNISHANFIISNSTAEKYNVSASTNTGSFNYAITSNETLTVYFELVREDGAAFSNFWIIPGSEAEKSVFPESYPQWLKNSVVTALAILCILGFSSYRVEVGMALGVGIVGLAYLWGEYEINQSTGYTIALMAFITIIEFVIQQRKEALR